MRRLLPSFIIVFTSLFFPALANARGTALVLAGGAARGYALLPILELIEELEIPIDMVIGVSAGSIVGALYCAGYSASEIRDIMTNLDWPAIFNDRPVYPYRGELPDSGLALDLSIGGKRGGFGISTGENAYKLFKTLTAKIPYLKSFDELPVRFRAAALRIDDARVVFLDSGDIAESIRASMSLPAIFMSCTIDGVNYADGGIRDNLPISEAKRMGYDTIIAVDLFPELQKFDVSPAGIVQDMLSMYFSSTSRPQYSQADLVIVPDVSGFSMMDFSAGKAIYDHVNAEKEKFRPGLARIKQKIGSGGTKRKNYSEIADPVPENLVINGALNRDKSFIEREFKRLIKSRGLKKENLGRFIERIYNTGNYISVYARTKINPGDTTLELVLSPVNTHETLLQVLASYNGSFISDSFGLLTLRSDFMARNFAGIGSVIGAGAQFNNALTLNGYYIQPLSRNFFTWTTLKYIQDTNIISSLLGDIDQNRPVASELEFKFGFQNSKMIIVTAGSRFVYLNNDASGDMVLGFTGEAVSDSLDSVTLPREGFLYKLSGELYFPLNENPEDVFNIVSTELCAAVPLSENFGIIFRGFAGVELSDSIAINPAFVKYFAYNSYDRTFFPHNSSNIMYGAHKGALLLTIEYRPVAALTIFGGAPSFSISAGATTFLWKVRDIFSDPVYMHGAFNAAVRFNDTYAVKLSVGAGNLPDGLRPFVSIDIGRLTF